MANFNTDPVLSFRAGGAIGRFLRVKLAADANNGGTRGASLSVAGATDREIGITENDVFDAGHLVGVRVRNAPGTRIMVANAAFAVGTVVYTAAAGKIGAGVTGSFRVGTVLAPTTADGDLVEVLPDPGDTAHA